MAWGHISVVSEFGRTYLAAAVRRRALRFGPLLTVLLAGCTVGPDFVPPNAGLPTTSFFATAAQEPTDRTAATSTNYAAPDPNWWAIFHDSELTTLENRVAADNLDVQTATLRFAQSRFQRDVAAAAQLPTLDGNTSYERQKPSDNGLLGLFSSTSAGGGFGGGTGGIPGNLTGPFSLWQYGFDASWELDIWGKIRRQVEAADAQAQASEEDRRAVLVSNLAEVARDYMQLRGIQKQIRIARENVATESEILKVTRLRQERGLVTGLDVETAASQVDSVQAELPDLQRQQSEAINALSLLLGQAPGVLADELIVPEALPPSPPKLPVGIPSDLARRRPDIREAEEQLHAATADVGVAIGDFYPSVSLNGSVGFQALDLKNLWKGTSLQYAMGPNLTLPIFEGGRLKGTLALRTAQQQEAAIIYHETVLKAWHDVVNALVAYRTERERHGRLSAQVVHARKALDLARDRYNNGVAQFITVLDAERTLLEAEQQSATSETNVAIDLVALYKALGGGWETTFPGPSGTIATLDPPHQ